MNKIKKNLCDTIQIRYCMPLAKTCVYHFRLAVEHFRDIEDGVIIFRSDIRGHEKYCKLKIWFENVNLPLIIFLYFTLKLL